MQTFRTRWPGHPLDANIAAANPASRQVVEKIGFDLIRQQEYVGVPCDLSSSVAAT